MRRVVVIVACLLPGLVWAQGVPRTPNLALKFTRDTTTNDNFVRLDDVLGTITDYPHAGVVDRGGQVYNVKAYGATGDGTTDDYTALQSVVTAVNAACAAGNGATVLFPPGTYKINQYRIDGGGSANGITNLTWTGCQGLVLSGYGATIDLKGNFHRAQDNGSNSYSNAVVPFRIVSSTNVVVEGFTIDGNVDQMTKDVGTLEGFAHGIATGTSVENLVLRDLELHHLQTDGLYLGGTSTIATRNVTVERVISRNNGRQGMSIIQARGVTVRDSQFIDTCITGGSYGSHAPCLGIDIEPDACATGSGLCANQTMDVNTGDIAIERTYFANNTGGMLSAILPHIENVTIADSTLIDGADATTTGQLYLAVNGGTLRDSYFRCTQVASCAIYPASSSNTTNARTYLLRNRIETDERGIEWTSNAADVYIIGNKLKSLRSTAATSYFPYLQRPASSYLQFKDNVIFYPSAAHDGVTAHEVSLVQNADLVTGNKWTTDLATGGLFFSTNYSGSVEVYDERFVATYWTPDTGWTNNGQPYAAGDFAVPVLNIHRQAQTVASDGAGTAAAFTITPTRSVVRVTCNDTDGCDATLSETGINDGDLLVIQNASANSVTVADSSGVQETSGGATLTLSQYETAAFIYMSDRWVELAGN